MNISLYRMIPPDVRDSVFVNSVPLMNVISHEIEDVVFENELKVDFFAGFQRFSYFTRQIKRYTRLASVCRRVYVWGVPDIDPPAIPGVEYMPLTPDMDLAREWFLVVDTPTFFTALLTQEVTYGQDLPKGYRRFEGIWTYDSEIVSRAHLLVSQMLGRNYPGIIARDYEQQSKHLVQISNRLVQRQDKQASREVLAQHHSSLLQAGMAHIELPLFVVDSNHVVITASMAAAMLLDTPLEELAGVPFVEVAGGALAGVTLEATPNPASVAVTVRGKNLFAHASSISYEGTITPMGWIVTLQSESSRPALSQSASAPLPIAPMLQRYLSGMQQLITMLPSLNTRPEVQQRVITQMQRLVTEANDLVQRLALVQVIESQPLDDVEEVDLYRLAQQVLSEWQANVDQYHAELAAAAEAITVRGNSKLLQQAIRELLDNVAQHAKGDQARLQLMTEANNVVLVVQDNGVGIDQGELTHIFDPHYHAANGNTATGRIGLGLSLARAIARAHKGALEAESVVGQGSTFRLVLPA